MQIKKMLNAEMLYAGLRRVFEKLTDNTKRSTDYSLADCLMSGLALFSLKYPSLLQFDQQRASNKFIQSNMKNLFGVEKAPCDTTLRERLDEVESEELTKGFNKLLSYLQRGKQLEKFAFYNGHYLLPLDATGYFSSEEVHCESCCSKTHRDGRVTYYHQVLSTVLVNPNQKEVFPFAPEPIIKQYGVSKNDCERNAAKRLLPRIRREHPHLKIIVAGDGLYSNGPFIRLLQENKMGYILVAQPDDHKYLFEFAKASRREIFEERENDGTLRRYEWVNKLPLNDANAELEVNFLEYWEYAPNGKLKTHYTWISDITLSKLSVKAVMQGGRARWKIENETFNTLKNQGYEFEHNFGHGYKNLSTVFANLMMLAFFVDQILQHCCKLVQAGIVKKFSKKNFWSERIAIVKTYFVKNWHDLHSALAFDHVGADLCPNTS